MRTTWKVTEVRMVEGRTTATLVRGQWFKTNPEFVKAKEEYDRLVSEVGQEAADQRLDDGEYIDEFVDLDAPEPGAEWVDVGDGSLTIDITDGLDLRPGDPVVLTIDVLDRVPS